MGYLTALVLTVILIYASRILWRAIEDARLAVFYRREAKKRHMTVKEYHAYMAALDDDENDV